jgi:hypothetical protein
LRPQEIGAEFEQEFIERHGLRSVPGSGNQWHSKLDAAGRGARWSLKATADRGYRITPRDILELLAANGPGEDGAIRLMAVKTAATTEFPVVLVVMLEDDFKQISTGQVELFTETKVDAKRRLASIPELLRYDDEED